MVQLSHPYMTTGKTITLTIWTFFGKVMSLLLKMLSKFVVAFLPRSKCLLILWLQSLSAVILDPKKIKICPCIHYFSIYLLWSDGTGYHELRFFECWVLSQLIHSLPSPSSRDSLVPLRFLPLDVQFSSVTQSCPTLFDPMDCSISGLPVHHQLPELAQVHCVSDAIQPSHPLPSPSPLAFNLSQHQGLSPEQQKITYS